ncbi:MAG: RluA family pseudouridine synthase [Acidobacteria bacterium]|nr:RluA family pseudouridine synthase [Acidobacteriota bacterium]
MTQPLAFVAEPEQERKRLDLFLVSKLPGITRSAVQRWINAGAVLVNGVQEKAKYPVKTGDHIIVTPPEPEPAHLKAEEIPLSILYEDPFLVVIDKPAGIVVHPGAGNRRGTLANALAYHFGIDTESQHLRPGIVHRLDKETSGLMVVAKDERTQEFLASQFRRRKVEKQYLALVYGRLPRGRRKIEFPLARDPRVRTRFKVVPRGGRSALTEYELVCTYHYKGETFSYVRVFPLSGRTHQIRVHFQHVEHPIVGDKVYGRALLLRAAQKGVPELNRHFLHATFLSFLHPVSRQRMSFESPLPEELASFLKDLE